VKKLIKQSPHKNPDNIYILAVAYK